MSSAYYRLKKHRKLKQRSDVESMTSYVEQNVSETLDSSIDLPMEIDVSCNSPTYSQYIDISKHPDIHEHDNSSSNYFDNSSQNLSDSSFGYSDRSPDGSLPDHEFSQNLLNLSDDDQKDILVEPSFCEKLQDWAVKYRNHLTVEMIEDLLGILREENIPDLPKSATTLLQTKSNTNIKPMNSLKNTTGFYMYLGIEQGLKDIITDEYSENVIRLLFNIDGLPLSNGSNQQFWPILGLILHNNYDSQPFIVAVYSGDSKPFIVAVYSGDSKPQSIDEYLEDYVKEAKSLIENGN